MLIAYLIFAFCAFFFLVALTFYFSPGSPDDSVGIPGPDPSDAADGNLGDIAQAGSLPAYLEGLHDEYGPIVSFWWGKQNVVSFCAPLVSADHPLLFDRPVALFEFLEPLLSEDSLFFLNGPEGKQQREKYDVGMTIDAALEQFNLPLMVANQMIKKWAKEYSGPGDHFPIHGSMLAFAIRAVSSCLFGDMSEDQCKKFGAEFNLAYDGLMLLWLGRSYPEDDPRQARFKQSLKRLKAIVGDIVRNRLQKRDAALQAGGDAVLSPVFLDRIVDCVKRSEPSEDLTEAEDAVIQADAMTYFVKGFYPIASLLTWALYNLAKDKDVQHKLREEFDQNLSSDPNSGSITEKNYSKMKYCRAVIDETLRWGKIVPIAARCSEKDHKLGDHVIPAYTPVIHAIGASMDDPESYDDPGRFDPERFFSDSARAEHNANAFAPFGFSGVRKCPGFRFAYVHAMALLSAFIQQFKLKLVDDALEAVPQMDFVTKPRDEIHVFLEII